MKETLKEESKKLLSKIATAIVTFLSALIGGWLGNGGI